MGLKVKLHPGDLITLTTMEHHSNLVPWQMLAAEKGLNLEFIPMTPYGLLDMEVYRQLSTTGTETGGFHTYVQCAGDHQSDHNTTYRSPSSQSIGLNGCSPIGAAPAGRFQGTGRRFRSFFRT